MPSVASQIGSLFQGIFNTFQAALGTVLAVFQGLINGIIGLVSGVLRASGDVISGVAHTFEGLLKFFFNNLLIIGVAVGGLFLYGVYVQRNGKAVPSTQTRKKIN